MSKAARLAFDLEADSFFDNVAVVHCIAIKDLDSGVNTLYRPHEIQAALGHLSRGGVLYGHNAIDYDLRVLAKLHDWHPKAGCKIRDTLIWGKLAYLDLAADDIKGKSGEIRELNGSHSLRAWGIRLGVRKLDYDDGFERYSERMGTYCQGDVETLHQLIRHLGTHNVSEATLDLETQFAQHASAMSEWGFEFDLPRAEGLYASMQADVARLKAELAMLIPPRHEETKTPQYWELRWHDENGEEKIERRPTRGQCDELRKSYGIKSKNCTFEKGPMGVNVIPFNPNSRDQVSAYLYDKYEWVSPEITETGEKLLGTMPSVDLARQYGSLTEDVLRDLGQPEGGLLADIRLAGKAASFLKGAKEDSGWLAAVKTQRRFSPNLTEVYDSNRIHHRMDSLGCVTGRCAHSNPNLGQTPSVVSKKGVGVLWGLEGRYGADCRSLFTASHGYGLVGTDISGIEARNLGHYLAPYDGGAYCLEVLQGDIHQLNVNSFKTRCGYNISRNNSKTVFYGWCYGAGDMKLGRQMASTISGAPEAAKEYVDMVSFYRKHPARITQQVWSSVLKKRRTATPEEAAYMTIGAKVSQALESGIDGLEDLLKVLQQAAEKKYVNVIDRRIPVRSPHAVLNTVLQGAAAVIAKRWVCLLHDQCRQRGIDWHMLAFVHDEVQADVLPPQVEEYMALSVDCIRQAGEFCRWRIPLTGESKSGQSWADCH